MRFSLSTLILTCLWIGTATGVYLRTAWTFEEKLYPEAEVKQLISEHYVYPVRSADKARMVDSTQDRFIEISEWNPTPNANYWGRTIFRIQNPYYSAHILPIAFVDDDTILFAYIKSEPKRYFFMRRHFPEAWWGCLYRPEVWACAILSVLLLRRFYKWANDTHREWLRRAILKE